MVFQVKKRHNVNYAGKMDVSPGGVKASKMIGYRASGNHFAPTGFTSLNSDNAPVLCVRNQAMWRIVQVLLPAEGWPRRMCASVRLEKKNSLAPTVMVVVGNDVPKGEASQ